MNKRKIKKQINGVFAPRTIDMLRSAAMRGLSLTGYRILERIEIELAAHGGKDNGRLPVTHEDFRRHGIARHSIGPGLREVEALGFVEITQHGLAGNAEYRRPNLFRLTYRPTDDGPPTDEWRRIATVKDAKKIAAKARGFRPHKIPAPAPLNGGEKLNFSAPLNGGEAGNSRPHKMGILSRYLATSLEVPPEPRPQQPAAAVVASSSDVGALSACPRAQRTDVRQRAEPGPEPEPEPAPATGKRPWSTPTLIEITDPAEIFAWRRIAAAEDTMTIATEIVEPTRLVALSS